ncbi:MAG TPA: hypothetical protein VEJ87_03140 [Acidimicrobiales bacterium]|nr:hypothetical protein [Acidimicrobiales bacterium]
MPEGGLSPTEVGHEIAGHAQPAHSHSEEHHDWGIAVVEAVLLALVAVLAAWSGYSSAKWSTESRLKLAQASTARTEASNNELASMTQRNFDSSTFEAWFTAYVVGNAQAEAVAERRFTPNFHRAFNAWMATDPFTNPNAPAGPTYMPEYKQPRATLAAAQNKKADLLYDEGSTDGNYSDDYVRATVYLATVLFLIAISGHFRIRSVRIGLIAVGCLILAFAVTDLATLPFPPT